MQTLIKPTKLNRGDTVAILSASSGAPGIFPGIFDAGLAVLRDRFGLVVREMPHAREMPKTLYENPQMRVDDLHAAFLDPEIKAIISSIGGYESVRLLPLIDVSIVKANPKIIMGFSDTTTLLSWLHIACDLVTFQGPSVMAGFAQLPNVTEAAAQHIEAMLFGTRIPYSYPTYPEWYNGYADWSVPETIGQLVDDHKNPGWEFIQGTAAEGPLWGGNIEVLEFLKGTRFWPTPDFFAGKVLYFETSEEKPLPGNVGYMLRNYGIQGVLDKCAGIVFARPKDYSQEEREKLSEIVKSILTIEFPNPDLPVVMNVDGGHTDPKLIFPLGCRVRLDPEQNAIVLLESPFRDE